MTGWIFWKILGDTCLYFSAIGAVPALFAHRMTFLIPVLLCAIGVTAAAVVTWQGRRELRLWCAVLPLLSLGIVGSVMEFLILLPVLGYCCAVIYRCEFYLEYYEFREGFLRTLAIWCCAFLIIAVFHGLEGASGDKATLAVVEPLCYGLLWILSGVLLCRMLRMGPETGRRPWSAARVAVTLGVSGAAVACAVGFERLLQARASSLSALIGRFFAVLIGLPGQLFSRFVEWVLSLVDRGFLEYAFAKDEEIRQMTATAPLPTEEAAQQAARTEPGFPWWLAVLVLSGMAVILICMLRQLRSGAPATGTVEITEKLEAPARKRTERRRSNRSQVRKYYRNFLKAEKRKGLRLQPHQTSADILMAASPETDREAAERLRQVYLAARYDRTREVTKQQVEAAKEAWKQIRDKA